MSFQDKFYKNIEANAFFARHITNIDQESLRNSKKEILKILLKNRVQLKKKNILEIGCFIGDLLQYCKVKYNSKVYGIEPSSDACKYAKKKYNLKIENNTFHESSKSSLIKSNYQKYDLIIVEDVLSWIDRTLILQTISSLDWLLKTNGYIFLRDFSPKKSFAVRNHHYKKEKIYNFKQSNGHKSFLLMTGKYLSVYSKTYSTSAYQKIKSTNKNSLIWNDTIIKKVNDFTFPIFKL